jgi:hypothetical protein
MNDELREQLGRLDPMHPGVPVESATTPSSTARMEQIMNTPVIDHEDSSSRSAPEAPAIGTHRRRRNQLLLGAAAAVIVAIAGAVIVGNSGGGDSSEVAAGPPIELSLGDSNVMSSCIVFDVAVLADMSPAFAGTATSVEGETVTLTVDRWYAGGDATSVVLEGAVGSPALIDGFEFEVGQQYLITAAGGNVNFCGYSGLATPELTAAFDAAFPS